MGGRTVKNVLIHRIFYQLLANGLIEPSEGDPIGIAVLCWQCNKTHEAVIRPRQPEGGEG